MNSSHCPLGIAREEPGWLSDLLDVEEGSKPRWPGVRSALRFCVIESSVVLREMRRKSGEGGLVS
jgi:hypothetical protein